eukprot:XP_001703725.1 predicted protein [Chlamydomonas reinhardtii]
MMLQQRTCVAGAQRSVAQRVAAPVNIRGRSRLVVRASADDEDAELEKRLAKLRTAKGATPYGEGVKAAPKRPVVEDAPTPKKSDFRELQAYILRRRDELTPKDSGSSGRGAQLTQEELLGEPVAGGKGKGKGFA